MIEVILLAAGLSRRMGEENKLLLPYGDSTILETTLNNILKAEIGQVYVVIGHESEKTEGVLNKIRDIIIVKNPDYEQGMLTSIQAGIKATQNPKLKTQNPNYMICLSDMPLISPEEYCLLTQSFYDFYKKDTKTIVQPIYKGARGNPVIFSHVYKNAILNLLISENTEGCRPIVQANKQHVHLVEMPTPHILHDIDKKEDYLKLLE
jgi:molybdenum cofactor cytidylyltransferase